jgi:hypothetical protein
MHHSSPKTAFLPSGFDAEQAGNGKPCLCFKESQGDSFYPPQDCEH